MTPELSVVLLAVASFAGGIIVACIACFVFSSPVRARALRAERRIAELEETAIQERTAREVLAVEKATAAAAADRVPQLEQAMADLRSRCTRRRARADGRRDRAEVHNSCIGCTRKKQRELFKSHERTIRQAQSGGRQGP